MSSCMQFYGVTVVLKHLTLAKFFEIFISYLYIMISPVVW
jgi:hypothetical protein